MADDRHRQDRPPQNRAEDQHHLPQTPSHFSPASSDHHHQHQPRAPVDAPRTAMAATVTLPSIHETFAAAGYGSQPPPPPPPPQPTAPAGRPYAHDARFTSPHAVNGYPPPSAAHQPPATYLPPLQTSPGGDGRSPAYPPPDQRAAAYYDDRRPPGQYADHQQAKQYAADGYYYRGPPPGPVPPNGYPRPPQAAYQEYAQQAAAAPAMAQAAPRQRTSIACRYCRKRKIRCSGYQNTPGGKCQNCARMNQECIFQPVSSSSSTAFIPVSAVPGGVPPGTQLFGAYGQPLAPSSVPAAHPYPQQQQQQPQHAGGPPPPNFYPPPPQQAQQSQQGPTQSPTGSLSSHGDEASQVAGRRRRRTPEEREEGYRLPPPRGGGGAVDEDPRRRSPAEQSGDSSPGGRGPHPPYQPSRQSPRSAPPLAERRVEGGGGVHEPAAEAGAGHEPDQAGGDGHGADHDRAAEPRPGHHAQHHQHHQQQQQQQQQGRQGLPMRGFPLTPSPPSTYEEHLRGFRDGWKRHTIGFVTDDAPREAGGGGGHGGGGGGG